MFEQLVKANVSKDPNLIDSVRSMLEELRAVWQEAIEKIRAEEPVGDKAVYSGGTRPQGGVNFAG